MFRMIFFFFFNDTATTEIYTLSLHDALPILRRSSRFGPSDWHPVSAMQGTRYRLATPDAQRLHAWHASGRSEEHTSELQSRQYLVCRLLLEKKQKMRRIYHKITKRHTMTPQQ